LNVNRLFAYDHWANREILAEFTRVGVAPEKSLRWLAHIIAAEDLWLARLMNEDRHVVVWPTLDVAECERYLHEQITEWDEYLTRLTPDILTSTITYRNTKGEPWTNTVQDILTHVSMHSVYHRGQIAADLRANGHEPPYTDYIVAVRRGHI
jgi:uncharacterized damage-inducible protein DinB